MSDNTTQVLSTVAPAVGVAPPPQPQAEAEPAPIDVDVVNERLDKHIQRLPWAASRMDGSPSSIQAFLVNWIVPMLTDMHTMTSYSIDSNQSIENEMDALAQYAQRTLVTAQNTLQGESLALLHMHFARVHSAIMSKLAPTDPASFALAEMHEVFVKLGFAEPYETPADNDAAAAGGASATAE
jgi:hypothetical protein